MYPMSDELRLAAGLMSARRYLEAANAYRSIYSSRPEHAAIAASQVGAALFFLRDFRNAIAWYQEAGRLGFDAQMTADNVREAQEAMSKPYTPQVGDVVLVASGELLEYRADGTWKPRTSS
jgi:hypothetical protein